MDAIEDLQIRVSFQEDHIYTLNQTVARQQRELDDLKARFELLQARLFELERNMPQPEGGDSGIEVPPHY